MRSIRLQLAVTFAALAVAAAIFAWLGLPPGKAIWDAVAKDDPCDIQRHLRWGAAEAKDEFGRSAMHWAARFDRRSLAELLVDRGAEMNARDKDGLAPLHTAAAYGSREVVRLLLDGGADIGPKSGNGKTPLHWAAFGGSREVAQLLLDRGAEINATDKGGLTPLDTARLWGHASLTEFLRSRRGVSGKDLPKPAP